MTGLASIHAALHIRTLCFVHFYSGYRRVGDLQHQIEAHWIQETTQIFCVSVDFCIQKDGGDLTLDSSREFWLSQIYAGAICGVGGGPPCETFTAARLMPGGPEPLRSFDHMNSMPYNTRREWAQTHIGSILLRFILIMVVAAARVCLRGTSCVSNLDYEQEACFYLDIEAGTPSQAPELYPDHNCGPMLVGLCCEEANDPSWSSVCPHWWTTSSRWAREAAAIMPMVLTEF